MKIGVGEKMSVIRLISILLVTLTLFSSFFVTSSGSWPMFLHDPQHTGNATSSAPSTNDTLWTVPSIGGNGYSSPTVADGRVFITGIGILYCLYENNGTEIWSKTIGSSGMACSTPAVADGKVYVVSDKVYCFYENNGNEVWNRSVFGATGTSSPTVADNKVFVYTQTLYCFYANNGTEIWNKSVGGTGESTPAFADGKVFVNGGMLLCLYASNGTEIWNSTGGLSSSPAITDSKVFFNPGPIICMYANNGTEKWSQPNGGDGYSSPAVGNEKVFVNNWGKISCFYEDNGSEIWEITLPNAITFSTGCSTPAIGINDMLIVNNGDITYCLDATNGEEIWNRTTGGEGYSSPAISNGRVFVNQGTVYCFGVAGPPAAVDYIVIEDDAQNELDTVSLGLGESITIYAAGYNSTTSSFVEYVEVEWTESGGLGSFDPSIDMITTFTAGNTIGITTVRGENVSESWTDDLIVEVYSYTILKQGWNLISVPLIQEIQTLTEVLDSIDGLYATVEGYEVMDFNYHWRTYNSNRPFGNDLIKLNETMGFWIYITQPGDTIFRHNGTQPTENQSIPLHPGWNLVGYPSLTSYNRTKALNNLTFVSEVDAIWTFNATTQNWKEIGMSDYFEVGQGYWVFANTKCIWEVPL